MNKKKEACYIFFRRIIALLNGLCFYFCRLFPINQKRIVVCTFEGKGGFCCNPKYIINELHNNRPDLEIVWIVNDISKVFPKYIKKVHNSLWGRAYWLSTSKVWIDNYRKPYGTKKRKGQFYFQTWHAGIGFKKIGLLRGDAFSRMAYLVSKSDSDMIDCTMIDCKWCELMYPQGLLYNREMLFSGAPRCDKMFGDKSDYREKLRVKYGIKKEQRILLFAPTFRESNHSGKRNVFMGNWSIDFNKVIPAFEKKFGGEWILFIRVHPQIASQACSIDYLTRGLYSIDVSLEDDMYDILPGVDALITDYSSIIFEASLGDIPAFMYADDVLEYSRNRGGLHFRFHEDSNEPVFNETAYPIIKARFPYPIAYDNEELIRKILDFNLEQYLSDVRLFEKEMGVHIQGNASRICSDYIENIIDAKR